MAIYLFRRLFLALITMFILTLISFSLVYYPNSAPFSERPFLFGYLDYINQLMIGNLGQSSINDNSISNQLKIIVPITLELCILAIILASIVSLILSISASLFYNKWQDHCISCVALLGLTLPTFWLALLLVTLFSLHLDWLPISGRYDLSIPFETVTGSMLIDLWLLDIPEKRALLFSTIKHFTLPVITLSIAPMAEMLRILKSSIIEVSQQNYIKAATTRGLSRIAIIYRHILHNALPPTIPKLGTQFSTMLTLTMIVEIIFNWHGIGHWLMYALRHQDFTSISSGILVIGTLVILVNLCADIIGILANPLKNKELYVLK